MPRADESVAVHSAEMLHCATCQSAFVARNKRQRTAARGQQHVYCTPQCYERRVRAPLSTDALRLEHQCAVCGQVFRLKPQQRGSLTRKKEVLCSETCRVIRNRRRVAAMYDARKTPKTPPRLLTLPASCTTQAPDALRACACEACHAYTVDPARQCTCHGDEEHCPACELWAWHQRQADLRQWEAELLHLEQHKQTHTLEYKSLYERCRRMRQRLARLTVEGPF